MKDVESGSDTSSMADQHQPLRPEGHAQWWCALQETDMLAGHVLIFAICLLQAQILSQREATKRLGGARHSRDATLPVMFFGTLEIGWLQVSTALTYPGPCMTASCRVVNCEHRIMTCAITPA